MNSSKIPGNMRPFVALTFVLGCAFGAPADVAIAGGHLGYAGLGLAGVHGLGYAAAPLAGVHGLGYAAAPLAAAAPIAAPIAHAAPAAPAPYATATQGAGVTTVHQPAPIVTTQTEIHNVQDPVFVERKVDAPFDAPFYTQR